MVNPLDAILSGLEYDFAHFTIDGFTDCVAERLGRPIRSVPMLMPPGLFGAWIKGPKAEYILYESPPPFVHSVHIRLHEMSHILLGHRTLEINAQGLACLSSDGAKAAAQSMIRGAYRSSYGDKGEECEAEELSYLIQCRVFNLTRSTALAARGDQPRGALLQTRIEMVRQLPQIIRMRRIEKRTARMLAVAPCALPLFQVLLSPRYALHRLIIAILDRRKLLRTSRYLPARQLGTMLDNIISRSSDEYEILVHALSTI